MKRDEGTYGRIGKQYDEYTEIVASKPAAEPRGLPPQKPYVPTPHVLSPRPALLERKRGIMLSRMAKKGSAAKRAKDGYEQDLEAMEAALTERAARPSSLIDTRVIYCGDCLEQLGRSLASRRH